MYIKTMDESIASEAAAFYEVGIEIDKKVDEYIKNLRDEENAKKRELIKQIVAMMNLAFSCELFLKSRLDEAVRKTNRRHSLKDLFDLQETVFQEYVKEKVIEIRKGSDNDYDDTMFCDELKENSEIFFKWRYYYEGNTLNMNLQFVRDFSFVLFYLYESQLSILANNI